MALSEKTKLLVILGPTAVGKSNLAVQIAEWVAANKTGGFAGAEIISADSRQVYKGLDIGTGKITSEEMKGIPHHLLDIAEPTERFTAIQWKQAAEKAIADIISRGKIPIICGGTGFYISTLIDNLGFPDVKADSEEQKKLEALSVDELFKELKKVDPNRSSQIDPKNKRRLARAIIIARQLGSVPPITKPDEPHYDLCLIGINLPPEELKARIRSRLIARLDAGMIEEARKLHADTLTGKGLTFERMEELGLEYRYLGYFLKNELTHNELVETLSAKIWQYAKRQMTWFKKDTRISWYLPQDTKKIFESLADFFTGA